MTEDRTGPYMALPSCVLWNLIEILDQNDCDRRKILREVGRRTGEGVALQSGETLTFEQFKEFIFDHWMENGLGRPRVALGGDKFVIVIEEASEILPPSTSKTCDFSAGYMEGVASILMGKKFICKETELDNRVAGNCRFELQPQ